MDLVQRVVEEVAEQEDEIDGELPALYERLDPEALQEVVASAEDDALKIEFAYNEKIVEVHGDSSIHVRD